MKISSTLFLLVNILIYTNSQAQKWDLRVSFNALLSSNKIENTIINDTRSSTIIDNKLTNPYIINKRVVDFPRPSFFWDISLQRTIGNKQTISIGYRNFEPVLKSTIRNQFGNHGHWQTVSIPTVRLNYIYHLLKKDKINASTFSVFGGLLIHFNGADGTFGNGGWGSAVSAVDSSGNLYMEYIRAKVVGAEHPKYPTPYFNFGIDGGARLGKRWKVGLTIEASVGYKTLYIQKIEGSTNSASFSYEIRLNPYFFSGGIYFQYRIR